VLYKKLEMIEEYNKSRKAVAKMYHTHLEGANVRLLSKDYLETSSWHLYPVQCDSKEMRAKLANHLKDNGVSTTPFYEEALSEMTPFKGYEGEDKNAKAFAGCTLCLPISAFTTEEQVNYVCDLIKGI